MPAMVRRLLAILIDRRLPSQLVALDGGSSANVVVLVEVQGH
jgi:hypothetical protein